MHKLVILLVILLVGGAILCPLVMAFDPEPMPGDFTLTWQNQKFAVPVLWSLCASGGLALLYSFFRR